MLAESLLKVSVQLFGIGRLRPAFEALVGPLQNAKVQSFIICFYQDGNKSIQRSSGSRGSRSSASNELLQQWNLALGRDELNRQFGTDFRQSFRSIPIQQRQVMIVRVLSVRQKCSYN